jgi:hypothetical protein
MFIASFSNKKSGIFCAVLMMSCLFLGSSALSGDDSICKIDSTELRKQEEKESGTP